MQAILILMIILISLQSFSDIKNESEVGIVIISGEATSRTETIKHSSVLDFYKNQFSLEGRYLHLSNDSKNTEIWELKSRISRSLNDEIYIFVGKSFEGSDYKNNTDIGLKHESNNLINEIGYRRTSDKNGDSNLLRLYSEIKNEQFKLWVETLFDNKININFEPSLTFFLNNKLSLKISYLYKFKKERQADTIYITSLIAKY